MRYHEALKKVIDARVKGLEIKAPREPSAAVEDLMEALRTSIETAREEPLRQAERNRPGGSAGFPIACN